MGRRPDYLKIQSPLFFLRNYRAVTPFDITILLRQLATLITAGIPVIKSLEIMEKGQAKLALQLLLDSIRREILTGKDLSACLRLHPQYFDDMTCQLVKVGEHTGKLDTMLGMIAKYKENNLAFIKRIRQAFFYPGMITGVAVIVTICMFMFVIPRFAELFSEAKVRLPLLTRWIFYLSDILQHAARNAGILILVIISMALIPNRYTQLIKNRSKKIFLRLPIVYPCLQKVTLARFARTLAIAFAAGIPVNDALRLTRHAAGNPEFSALIMRLHHRINSGLQLHQAMETLPGFPDLMIQMVKIGEESGMLEPMLNKMADFLESDINHMVTLLNQLLEPLIMLMLGVLIGGLVIGMYLPIFKLGSVL
jgi:type IV pilus assembly protein PilC